MAIRVLAAADLHLGRRSAGLPANEERLASKNAWQRLVQWAIQHQVDAAALAGDIVDQDNSFYESIGPLQSGFDLLGQAGIEVFMVSGNHDYRVLPQMLNARHPHVHLLGPTGQWEHVWLRKHGEAVQFIGRSFPSQRQTASPVPSLRSDLWDPGHPVIGLVHGDLFDPFSPYTVPWRKTSWRRQGSRHGYSDISINHMTWILRVPGFFIPVLSRHSVRKSRGHMVFCS